MRNLDELNEIVSVMSAENKRGCMRAVIEFYNYGAYSLLNTMSRIVKMTPQEIMFWWGKSKKMGSNA